MKNILAAVFALFFALSTAHGIDLLDLAIAEDVGRSAGQRAAKRQIEEYKQENRAQLEKAAMWDEFEEYVQTHEGESKEELRHAMQEIHQRHEGATVPTQCQNGSQCSNRRLEGESEHMTSFEVFIVVICIVGWILFWTRPLWRGKENYHNDY